MNELPIVLVASEGKCTPMEIINNFRTVAPDADTHNLGDNLIGYKHHLTTKYYEVDICLLPWTTPMPEVPAQVLDMLQGMLIYFDADNRQFLPALPKYVQFLQLHQIELAILLCDVLAENETDGITYKEAKQAGKMLDVIELGRTRDSNDDENDTYDPLGYAELAQAFNSHLWSNIQLNSQPFFHKYESADLDKESASSEEDEPADYVKSVEDKLSGFERILGEMLTFKDTISSMSRNDRLAYAEGFANAFEKFVSDEGDDCSPPVSTSDQPSDSSANEKS